MTCIKTGCVAYLEPYGDWVYGDAHSYGGNIGNAENSGVLVLRIVWIGHKAEELAEFGNVRHFTVHNANHWWDEKTTSMRQNSTLIVEPHQWINHGYDGIPEPQLRVKAEKTA